MRVTVTDAFGEWLENELSRQGVSRRELGRRLATRYPGDGDEEAEDSQRRKVKRILSGHTRKPTQQTRDSICDALGVPRDSAPSAEDDAGDESLTRDELHEFRRLALKMERALAAAC